MLQNTLRKSLMVVTVILSIYSGNATSQVVSTFNAVPKKHYENVFVLSLSQWYLVIVISRADDHGRDDINGLHIMYGKNANDASSNK